MGDEESVKEALPCYFVDCGEREAPGSLEVGDNESVKEALSCCLDDWGERGSTVHLQWGIRRV